ncbi:zinc finger C2HC domain-containing protein 1C isoform X2 [Saccopteryx bilineata]
MASLHLVPPPPAGILLPDSKTEGPGLHSTKQDPCEKGDSSQQSSMGHLRNNSRGNILSNREPTLNNVYAHSKWNSCTKAGNYYPHCAGISQQDPRTHLQSQAKGLFYSAAPQFWYPKVNNQEFLPFTKKRVGVDRAYPLKPVFHRKSRSTGETGMDGDQNVSPRCPGPGEFSYSSLGLRNWAESSGVGIVAAMQEEKAQEEKALANPGRTEWMEIQRLEAARESLEEEIQRKETLLREKLKKTEVELRRIQKEKEQAEEHEKGELQRLAVTRRVKG